ncbi:efflux transporter outer membrane subunit [Novosphingobium flavum]|uniref:Efflux transporter outer membrane subunit n=1 Tax=Novosphingobium aerophilum TaxID=2839843 RepID=A0A7X1F9Z2_9SPHN|nr:efflux transporter outer membrane subunit [Novosphingobium aerophilum]MBC2653142.1 efflux transporter outer membrane subunit [Novosphingobium aerophilum]MBC2661553.1 efflux transporter outer membrane subunit [Novosphingobium aerophilum]
MSRLPIRSRARRLGWALACASLILLVLPFPPLTLPAQARTVPPAPVLPLPPGPAGNAPAAVLTAPIAPLSGPAQTLHPGAAVPADWWRTFASPALDALVDQALAANTDLAVAGANLRQAHELARAARGVLFPQVDAGYSIERQRLSGTIATPLTDPVPTLFSIHTAQLSLGYSLDLFGGNAARIASAKAAERATAARLRGVQTIVAGNVVLAAIQNAALDAQIEAVQATVDSDREILRLLKAREALGAIGKADVAPQEAALANAEGALPPLERARQANLAALSVLLGRAPGAPLPDLPSLDAFTLPGDLPLTLPSELVAQRPDVAAAAAAMEGAGADLKAAIAARLPSLTLSASAGGAARDFGDMFRDGNPFWVLLGGLTGPLFHGGSLRHQQNAAQAALEGAQALYRGTALQAFADVSNALTALDSDARALDAATRADAAAQTSLGYVRRQLELGSVGTLTVLNARATAQQARSQLLTARTMRLTDTVGLFTALGGGMPAPTGG